MAFLANAAAQRPDEGALLALKAMKELGVRTEIAGIETAPLPQELEAARPQMVFADGENISNIVHGESKVSVEDVLDILADAVLAIVLFQIEADENESHLVSTKFDGLVQACTFFAQLARQKAELWEESEEAQNKVLMLQMSDKMRDIVFEISKQLKKLQDNQYDQEAKEELMFKCREVMETTVALLEMSDRYDIRKILRLCSRAKTEGAKMNAPPALAQFEQTLHTFIQQTTLLSKYVEQRVAYLADPVMEARLTNANVDLRETPEKLVHAALATLQQPNNAMALINKEAVYNQLIKTVDDIEEAVIESQKRMFAGVLMDLEPIQRNNIVMTEPDDPNSADSLIGHFEGLLGQAIDALGEGAASRAGALLRNAGHWLDHLNGMARLKMEAMAEGPQKDLMGEALRRLQASLDSMVEVSKQLKLDPKNAVLLQELDRIFNHSVALDFLAAWNAPGFSDLFGPNVLATLAHLNQLKQAYLSADQSAAVLAAKSAAACLQQQQAEGQRVAAGMTPGSTQQTNLLDACQRVNGLLQNLLLATRHALDDPNDPTKREALFAAIEGAKLLAGELALLTYPTKDPGLFDDDALAKATQAVHDALHDLLTAVQAGDPNQLAGALRKLTEALAKQSGLARNASAASKYPAQVAKIQEIFGKIQSALGNLVNLSKELAVRPGDKSFVAQMQQALVGAHRVTDELAAASSPLWDQMLASLAQLQGALEALRQAAANAHGVPSDPQLLAALGDARELVAYQTKLAADHANRHPSLKEPVGAAATHHIKTLQALLGDLANILADPNRVQAHHQPALRESTLQLLEAMLRTEDTTLLDHLLNQSHKIEGLSHKLEKHVANPLDMNEVNASAHQSRQAISDGAELLELAARHGRTRGDQRSRLVQLASLLGDKIRDLLPSVQTGLQGDTSPLKLYLSSVRSLASEGADLLFDAQDLRKMMELEALKVVGSANPLFETPQITAQNRDDILGVLQHVEHLRYLAHATAKQLLTDPKDRREITQLSETLLPIQARIRETADLLLRASPGTPEAVASQNELRTAVRDAKATAEKLVHKAYGSDIAQRLQDNGAALERDLVQLQGHMQKGYQPESAALVPIVSARIERQKELAAFASQHCLNPSLREPLHAAIDRLTGLNAPFPNIMRTAIADIHNPAIATPALQLTEALRPANHQLTELAVNALKPVPTTASAGIIEITSLATAAQHMQVATENLTFDDTPKGRLNRAAWNIAQGMKELADAAAIDDKKAMIAAARKIASYTATLVQDATAVGSICRDRGVVDQLVSMARAGKNWSVQLKILCAVKASSTGRDETAESQLLTCATGLAQSVVQCVKEADVAELKHH